MQTRMRQASRFTAVAITLAVVLLAVGTALAQSPNSEVGTWKMNVAKSKFSPGTESKSGTIKVEAAGAGVKFTVDRVAADGTVRHSPVHREL